MTPLSRLAALLAAVVFVPALSAQPALPPPDKQAEKPEPGIQVLDKGPIHEAFAQPGADVRGKGMTAPKAPPPPVPEVAPDTKPEGANVKWVPGYWMWDADRKDFIWVSGLWRNLPPDREWQAGEWKKAANGEFAYTPGFWKPTNMNNWRVDLPEPPKSLENGPTTQASDPNATWVPGAWEYRNEQYVWRPGYWAYPNGNQLWQPPQYRQTPYGYSYVPGYWDYPLENRGMLYAPVYFNQPLYQNPGWYYTPQYALGLGYGYGGYGYGGLFGSLFIGPGYNNYYYGNYYPYGYGYGLGFGWPFFGLGFFGGYNNYYRPWYAHHHGYWNPTWHNYAWLNRNSPGYPQSVHRAFIGQALGVNPVAARVVTPAQAAIGPAASTAMRSAVVATQPRPLAASTPLVQPASQVSHAISAHNAARAAAPAAVRAANSPAAAGAALRPGGAGVVATPQYHYQSSPLHLGSGASLPGIVPHATGGTSIVPHSTGGVSMVPHATGGTSIVPRPTGGTSIVPHSTGGTSIVPRPTGTTGINPGAGIIPRSTVVPNIHYGSPGSYSLPSAHSIPSHASGIHTMPSIHYGSPGIHTMPSFHSGMPSIGHMGSFGGGHMGGMHMGGGHVGGGHVGGGGHGGGHR